MNRPAIFFFLLCAVISAHSQDRDTSKHFVVADSISRAVLPSATLFDNKGKIIGICDYNGRTPAISSSDFPITIRYLGFKEQNVGFDNGDTIFMKENLTELPELFVETRNQKLLHMLAYVREYSTLSTYSDTVFLFREKMVDYMLPTECKTRIRGWMNPRILKCKSYYHFTNAQGLDSVSDHSRLHFSWSDWVGIAPSVALPSRLAGQEQGSDTLRGKYSPSEIWNKNEDRIVVDVNILADSVGRKWVPSLSVFFRDNLDFENFRVQFKYANNYSSTLLPENLTAYSMNIESNGRGHDMFMFNRIDEPFFVTTYAEVYMIDKEYITVKEARKWERRKLDSDAIAIFEPADAPPLQPEIAALVERVGNVDKEGVRLGLVPDHRLAGRKVLPQHFGQRVLQLIKTLTGISSAVSTRKWNRRCSEIKKDIRSRNTERMKPEEE